MFWKHNFQIHFKSFKDNMRNLLWKSRERRKIIVVSERNKCFFKSRCIITIYKIMTQRVLESMLTEKLISTAGHQASGGKTLQRQKIYSPLDGITMNNQASTMKCSFFKLTEAKCDMTSRNQTKFHEKSFQQSGFSTGAAAAKSHYISIRTSKYFLILKLYTYFQYSQSLSQKWFKSEAANLLLIGIRQHEDKSVCFF